MAALNLLTNWYINLNLIIIIIIWFRLLITVLFFVSIFDPVSTLPAGATGCEKYATAWTGPSPGGSFDLLACFTGNTYTGVYALSDTSYSPNLLITQTEDAGYKGNDNVHPLTSGGFSYQLIDSKKFNIFKSGNDLILASDDVPDRTVSSLSDLPTTAPTSAPLCFSGSSNVQVDQDNKVISSIKIGEEVLAYSREKKVSKT